MDIFDWLWIGYNRKELERTLRDNARPLNQVLEQIRRDHLTPAERAAEDAERQKIAAYHRKVAKTEQLLAALFLVGFILFTMFAIVMASLGF